MYTSEKEIEDFLTELQRSRVIIQTTVRAALNRAIEFEERFEKPFYQFTTDEALEMYESAHAISVVSLQNTNLLLKNASRWFNYKNGMVAGSAYENLTKDLLNTVIDTNKQKSLILSREDIDDLQANLLNEIDKAILEMLFIGFGGKWLKELTFFEVSQVDTKDYVVYFKTGKTIPITKEIHDLLVKACEEDELISFGSTSRVSKVAGRWIYKVRFNALSDNSNWNDEQDAERRYRFVQRRLSLISQDLDVKLTSGGIQSSGLLWHLQQGVKETGLTFREYVRTEQAGKLARRYDIFSEYYSQILLEKFEQYFK